VRVEGVLVLTRELLKGALPLVVEGTWLMGKVVACVFLCRRAEGDVDVLADEVD
jgi:hypothetical protein